MDVLAVDLVLDGLEAEGLDFFLDFLHALVDTAVVAHGAVLGVEVDQVGPVLHKGSIVGFQELFCEGFHHCCSLNLK